MSVIIETSIGELTVDLYTDERPRCSKNFLKLCKVKYYNFSLFHSVQQNLVAQTGDPTATGRGGESVFGMVYGEQAKYFDMEVSPRIKHKKRGLLSMVNNGSGMHGSQFFITLGENLDYLDGVHTVFGEVVEGDEVLDKLNDAYCDEKHRPYRDIRIFHTVILDDPYDDPDGLEVPDKSPGPTKEMLESDRIGVDEEVDDTKGLTEKQVAEMKAEREAKANAQLLEMVGDLPDADVKPPDNVLFVCKLNPVTTDEDLEMIFSRFGPIVSCEVIKDHKTEESLQYAFIEFEKPEHCENAYFKMDNVLIDDRRIHVDFSQSVSKLKPPFRGKKPGEDSKADEDQPKYVLKDQQRKDDRYDLVYEHDDLSDKEAKKKKHKPQKPSDSLDQSDSKDKKKKKSKKHKHSRSRSRSPVPRNRPRSVSPPPERPSKGHRERQNERKRSLSPSPDYRDRSRKEKKIVRKRSLSPSPEIRGRDRTGKKSERRKSVSSSPEFRGRKERKNDRKRSVSSSPEVRDRGRKERKNDRKRSVSFSPEFKGRKEIKKNRKRSVSSSPEVKDRGRKERKNNRKRSVSSSPEIRGRKETKNSRKRSLSSSPENRNRGHKVRKNDRKSMSSSPELREKDVRRKKERGRSSSAEEDRRTERRKDEKSRHRNRSVSPQRDRRDKRRDRR